MTPLTQSQILAVLEAAGVANAKQSSIAADLLAIQGTPLPDPPISQDELRQMLYFINGDKGLERWASFPRREKQARKQFPTLFACLDACKEAEQALANEMSNLDKALS